LATSHPTNSPGHIQGPQSRLTGWHFFFYAKEKI
jgi:hypothetical protein